jgi:hypothetical protein
MPQQATSPGTIVGQVELAEGMPAVGAFVVTRGAPIAATADANGVFSLFGIPSGRWTLRVTHPLAPAPTVVVAAANAGEVTSAGVIRLKAVGSIRGRVVFLNPDDLVTAVVAVPEQGIATQPNPGGGYLLQGVAAGSREVVLLHARYGSADRRQESVVVKALETVDGPNFIQGPPAGPALVDFGLVLIGSAPQLVWKLSNPEALSAIVKSVAISGPDGAKFELGLVPALPISVGSTGLEVPLTVDASSMGTFTAELRVQGEAEGAQFTQTAALRAVVTPPPSIPLPDPHLVPIDLNFGAMPGPDTRPVELKNDGDATGTFYIAGSLGPFQLVNPPFPLSLSAHTSQTVTVRAVAPGATGPAVGFLRFVCEPGHRVLNLNLAAVWS